MDARYYQTAGNCRKSLSKFDTSKLRLSTWGVLLIVCLIAATEVGLGQQPIANPNIDPNSNSLVPNTIPNSVPNPLVNSVPGTGPNTVPSPVPAANPVLPGNTNPPTVPSIEGLQPGTDRLGVKVQQKMELPNNAGQYWVEYDLKPYTQALKNVDRPQQAVLDWIIRETGSDLWFQEPMGILTADRSTLRVYHNAGMQKIGRAHV